MKDYVKSEGKFLEKIGANVIFAERAGKIGSINRDMEYAPSDYDIIMQPADDFTCRVAGWNTRIVEELSTFDNYDGVIWFFDGYQPNIDTLSIMGRKYYERFNYIYHPEYRILWADVEFTEVADRLDRLIFSEDVLFVHEHPDWTHAQGWDGRRNGYDQLNLDNDKDDDRIHDEKLFYERRSNNFGLEL
jgi:hypothetical protein